MRKLASAVALASLAWAWAPVARAAPQGSADALFEEGRALMLSGDFAKACPKLQASVDLDPGIGALLNLGVCYERAGRTTSAWAAYRRAAETARARGDSDAANKAAARARVLEALRPRVVLTVQSPTFDERVSIDGGDIARDAWGAEIPLDPGDHAIVASSAAHATAKLGARAEAGRTVTIVIPPLVADAAPAAPSMTAPSATPAVQPAREPPAATPQSASPLRAIGAVATGLGVVSAGIGAYFGLQAQNLKSQAGCDASGGCQDQAHADAQNDAVHSANLSTALFVAGGVLAAGGVTLMLVAPSGPGGTRTALTVGPAGVRIGGTW